jgi:hypothetical protein
LTEAQVNSAPTQITETNYRESRVHQDDEDRAPDCSQIGSTSGWLAAVTLIIYRDRRSVQASFNLF